MLPPSPGIIRLATFSVYNNAMDSLQSHRGAIGQRASKLGVSGCLRLKSLSRNKDVEMKMLNALIHSVEVVNWHQ
jgi:hypothetical protein